MSDPDFSGQVSNPDFLIPISCNLQHMDSLSLFYPDPIHGLFSFFFLHKVVIYNKIVHPRPKKCIIVMVLILDGNSEIGAHVRRNLCDFIS